MAIRIALFGIYHESNTFIEKRTTIEDFKNGHWLHGNELIDEYRDAFHEFGGMIEVLEKHDVEIIPLSFAEATPGGTIAASTYEVLLSQLKVQLHQAIPVDGCLIALHGAAVSEKYFDMDGHWLKVAREIVGEETPMVGTLDLHANVSQTMVDVTDALISYGTNPHTDQRDTGRKAAELLLQIIHGNSQPVQQLFASPVTISIEQQHTGSNPCAGLYEYVNKLVAEMDLIHISINLGFPYADVYEMGTSFIIIQDASRPGGQQTIDRLNDYMKNHQESFIGIKKSIDQLLPVIEKSEKPVLLLDMGDNIGGGSPGNSLHLWRFFESHQQFKSFFSIVAPITVDQLSTVRPGETVSILLKDIDGEIYPVKVRLEKIVNGRFSEKIPRHGGQVNYNMGPTAIVRTEKGNTLMLMTFRVPPFSLEQVTAFGVAPAEFDVIVAKGVIAPMAAYSPVCKTILQVDTPGPTQAGMMNFEYHYRRKPLFPFESISD